MKGAESSVKSNLLIWLRVPLALEAANVLAHRIAHGLDYTSAYIDTVSWIATAAIVFYSGWVASRLSKRLALAVVAGLTVWGLSLALATLLTAGHVVLFDRDLPAGEGAFAIAGVVLSSMMYLPAIIAVAVIAGLMAKRRKVDL